MEEKFSSSMTQGPGVRRWHVAALWLPCGRVNFHREIGPPDGTKGLPPEALKTESMRRRASFDARGRDEASMPLKYPLSYRLSRRLRGNGAWELEPVVPPARIGCLDRSDPSELVFTRTNDPSEDVEGGRRQLVLATHDGFVVFAQELSTTEEAAFTQLRRDLVDLFWPFPDTGDAVQSSSPFLDKRRVRDYATNDRGALTWFQLNILLEGMYNPSFRPEVFFATGSFTGETGSTLRRSLCSVIAHVPSSESTSRVIETLWTAIQGEQSPNSTHAAAGLLRELVSEHAIRAFCRGTLQDALQPLKWNIEQCRRYLLDDMLGLLHRHERLEQIEFDGANPFRDANEDQLRGYVMLLSAKLPLLQNVGRYLRSMRGDEAAAPAGGRGARTNGVEPIPRYPAGPVWSSQASGPARLTPDPYVEAGESEDTARDYHIHWQALLEGIVDSLRGLENAISQVQRDRQLLEQERLRSEQEMSSEKTRVESRGVGRVSDWIFLLIYLLSLMAALPGFFGTSLSGGSRVELTSRTAPVHQDVGDSLPVNDRSSRAGKSWVAAESAFATTRRALQLGKSARQASNGDFATQGLLSRTIVRVWLLIAVVALLLFVRRMLAQFARHTFELDWRIDEPSDLAQMALLVNDGPHAIMRRGLARRLARRDRIRLSFQGARYEGFVENQTVEKLFFEGQLVIRQRPYPGTTRRPRASCYVTYTVRHDKPSQVSRAMLQNVKIICLSRAKLDREERRELIAVMFHTLVREALVNRHEQRDVPYLQNET